MYDAVAIGELLVDFACQSTDAGGYPAHPGGAPANFLAVLAHYGMKTALLAKVGDDVFGRLLCRTAAQAGIEPEACDPGADDQHVSGNGRWHGGTSKTGTAGKYTGYT